jgi:membrane protein implicated in regulation of membrane protease activity
MPRSANWILIFLGAALVLAEVLLGAISGFDFLLLGSAIVLGGILGLVTGSATVGVVTAGILSLLYIALGRRKIKSRLARRNISSNVDALLGKTVRVVEAIAPGRPGRVKYEGEEWRAEIDGNASGALEAGHSARINRIDGVTVYVVPV